MWYFVPNSTGYTNACCEVNLHKKICAIFGMEMSSVLEMHSAKSLNFMSTKSLQLEGSSFYRFTSNYQKMYRNIKVFVYKSKGINRTKYANTAIRGNIRRRPPSTWIIMNYGLYDNLVELWWGSSESDIIIHRCGKNIVVDVNNGLGTFSAAQSALIVFFLLQSFREGKGRGGVRRLIAKVWVPLLEERIIFKPFWTALFDIALNF